jgi:hypothetical protein
VAQAVEACSEFNRHQGGIVTRDGFLSFGTETVIVVGEEKGKRGKLAGAAGGVGWESNMQGQQAQWQATISRKPYEGQLRDRAKIRQQPERCKVKLQLGEEGHDKVVIRALMF